ncbi:MAG TPA: neutral/alkaline non-lysosomal ceramidase N-terminal domain-containing protein, partial [Candidatus Limnocylindrales bacterium]|nr:neutral/alkaline non-lysosomal ceramidase N-terminal domain-containing protein [Candidatus Limnocylindrales bacterium]
AGAASVEIVVPAGTPLAGYGGFPRRAWLPDLLDRVGHAFWFHAAAGVHDAPRARALALESGSTRVLWLTVDLVGVDPSLLAELRARLARAGLTYSGVILSASHTHSGPGAYGDSALFAFVAIDRLSRTVRGGILDALERAAREAEARKVPARAGGGRAEVTGIARSRLAAPLDPELGVLKIVGRDGRPLALVWNYAIHGTALGRDNSLLSGDLMAEASSRIERQLDAPALFVNGAVGDVSPVRRGWEGVRLAGSALAAAALAAWDRIPPEDARVATLSDRVRLPEPALRVRNCLGGWLPRWLEVGLGSALPPSAEMVALAVGGTGWVTVPGELQTRLGLDVKAAGRGSFSHVFVAGVSNDYLGYFLTPEAFDRPSYIACASLYGERGGEAVRDAAIGLLQRLGRELK